MPDTRFESFTVEARANTTARTIEVRVSTESGWLSHIAILDSEAATVLRDELLDALAALALADWPSA